MNRNDCQHNEIWDFCGHMGVGVTSNFYSQRDWNQTLLTKINMISHRIRRVSLRGGGDTIELHPKMLDIIESFPFFNVSRSVLLSKFKVIINSEIEENIIFVYYKQGVDEIENARIGSNGTPLVLIPIVNGLVREPLHKLNKKTFIKKKKTTPPPSADSLEMTRIEFTSSANLSEEQVLDHKRGLVGYIEVINYH